MIITLICSASLSAVHFIIVNNLRKENRKLQRKNEELQTENFKLQESKLNQLTLDSYNHAKQVKKSYEARRNGQAPWQRDDWVSDDKPTLEDVPRTIVVKDSVNRVSVPREAFNNHICGVEGSNGDSFYEVTTNSEYREFIRGRQPTFEELEKDLRLQLGNELIAKLASKGETL